MPRSLRQRKSYRSFALRHFWSLCRASTGTKVEIPVWSLSPAHPVFADLLGLSIDRLAGILVELERLGLIEPGEAGVLRLRDIGGLESLANQPLAAAIPSQLLIRLCDG